MRIAWMSDIHLNFLGTQQIEAWLQELRQSVYDGIVISGDIGEAYSFPDYLIRMVDTLQIPLYVVLGNHDYYRASIASVHRMMAELVKREPLIHWLDEQDAPIALSDDVALIGHEGWGDGQYGNYFGSGLILNDYVLIEELRLSHEARLPILKALGERGGAHLARLLPVALEKHQHVYVVMHAPPFQETCYHDGKAATDDNLYLPHFTCKAHGDVLLQMAAQYPDKQITVLCGHTHGACDVQMRPNLRVCCAEAEYGKPDVAAVLEV